MARIYEGIWEHGHHKDLPPAHHYRQTYYYAVKSLVVNAGETVTFYQNADRSGDKSHKFYEGTYHDLSFYNIGFYPGMIHVEKTPLKWNDLVEIGYYANLGDGSTFYMCHKLPIGDHKAPDSFWNDRVSHLQIPFGVSCEVFRDKDNDNSLIFDGTDRDGRTHIGLPDYNYAWCASRIRVTADDWVSAGIALENEVVDSDEVEGGTFELANNSDHAAEITKTITTSVEDSTEEAWEIGASVSASAGFQFGPEVSQGSVGIEVTVSGGYGETKTKTTAREVTDEVKATVEGKGIVKGSIMIERGIMTADAIRKWRNKRTGDIIEEHGKIKLERASKTRVEVH